MLKFFFFIFISNYHVINLSDFNGVYKIKSILNGNNILICNDILTLSNETSSFFKVGENSYYIKLIKSKKYLFISNNNIIIKKLEKHQEAMIWNLIQTEENQFLIQNKYYKKYIGISNFFFLILSNNIYNKSFYFEFLKLYEEVKVKIDLKIINKEPIDIVIKYIDVMDKNLNKSGIKHIYKDKDNDELKYSVRSILENVPWIRKIFIVMPNEKIRFFKSQEEIKEKIIYVKDKDLLGYDSANNVAFSLNLHKMEKFGVSKNFIYMDDDYFYGKPLKKSDFFYYDNQKLSPYIIASKFQEINKTYVLEKYHLMFKYKDFIDPHSSKGFALSILCTEKFYIENFNISLIRAEHTHNAIPLNIEDLKEIFELVKKYKYINETLQSKERYILRLSQQHSYNLYQLNIKNKKVHSIPYKYIQIESIKKHKFNTPLFVLNTGGNHIPLKRQYIIEQKIMRKAFTYPHIYEIHIKKSKMYPKFFIIHIYLIFTLIKIYTYFRRVKDIST